MRPSHPVRHFWPLWNHLLLAPALRTFWWSDWECRRHRNPSGKARTHAASGGGRRRFLFRQERGGGESKGRQARLSPRCQAGAAGRCKARSPAADHVRRRSAVRTDEPAAACWAPLGVRPQVASQLIREYIYLYGAVAPKDGTCVYLILPTSNTACFQAFLDTLSRRFARQQILLVLDGAPNHRSGQLVIPDNISLLFLPLTHRNSTRRKICGMKSARKSSRTMRSNPSTPSTKSSKRRSIISNATPRR
jgi:hypothetical protein